MRIPQFRYLLLAASSFLFACSGRTVKEKINSASEKAGEVIGETAKGVSRGLENAFQITILKKDSVALSAIDFGKILLSSDSSGSDNKLSVYIIYNNDLKREVTLKVFDKNKLEIGRSRALLNGKKDQAVYIDFIFDPHTNIDRDCLIIME